MVEAVGRLFLAVDLPPDARSLLASRLDDAVGGRRLPGRAVPAANWHLTLRFLGEVEACRGDRLLAALDGTDLGRPFSIRFGGLGAFPRPPKATVLWVGIDRGTEDLARLAGRVGECAEQAGFEPEDRPFRSHLTISRIRPHQDVRPLLALADDVAVPIPVRAVSLFRSRLGRGGARYEELERFPLS